MRELVSNRNEKMALPTDIEAIPKTKYYEQIFPVN